MRDRANTRGITAELGLGCLLVGLAWIAGCRTPEARSGQIQKKAVRSLRFTEDQLRDVLFNFADRARAEIEAAAQLIDADAGNDRTMRKTTLLWRSRMIPLMRRALFHDDPRQSLIDVGALVYQHEDYLTEGEGAGLFGASQPIAVSTAYGIRYTYEDLVFQLIGEDDALEELRRELQKYAKLNPVRGRFSVNAPLPSAEPQSLLDEDIQGYLLTPFKALGGLDSAADAVRELASSADEIGQVAREMPDVIRWNTQLVALELEDYETTTTARETMRSLSTSAAQLTELIDEYPERMRKELAGTMEDAEAGIGRIAETVKAAQATASETRVALENAKELRRELGPTLEKADALARSGGELAVEATSAADAWKEAVEEVTTFVKLFGAGKKDEKEEPPPAPGQEKKPVALEVIWAIREAATELRGTAADLRAVVESDRLDEPLPGLDARIDQRIEKAAVQANELIDKVTTRAMMLLVGAFTLSLLWVIVAARMRRREESMGTQT